MTWDLPWKLTLLVLMVTFASITPAPLWAAAMAPLPAQRDVQSLIEISTFRTSNASTLWDGDLSTAVLVFGGRGGQWLVNQGLFAFDTRNIQGALRDSARAASVVTEGKSGTQNSTRLVLYTRVGAMGPELVLASQKYMR